MASRYFLCLCVHFIIGLGMATDIPFPFEENFSMNDSLVFAQLEKLSESWLDLRRCGNTPINFSDNEFGGRGNIMSIDCAKLMKTITHRVETNNNDVCNLARIIVARDSGDLTISQICSLYSYLIDGNSSVQGWSDVRDPSNDELFNYANKTLDIGMKSIDGPYSGVGDCDEFATVMASLVGCIGGTTRIIVAHNEINSGHMYAEVYLGRLDSKESRESVNAILNWIKEKYSLDKVFISIDSKKKEVWLNLDRQPDESKMVHPGGPFYQAKDRIIIDDIVFQTKPLSVPPTCLYPRAIIDAIYPENPEVGQEVGFTGHALICPDGVNIRTYELSSDKDGDLNPEGHAMPSFVFAFKSSGDHMLTFKVIDYSNRQHSVNTPITVNRAS